MDKTQRNLPLIFAIGALWSLVEPTAGGGMHVWHLPSYIWLLFPLGAAFLMDGVYHTGRPVTALALTTVATLVKLTNRFAL